MGADIEQLLQQNLTNAHTSIQDQDDATQLLIDAVVKCQVSEQALVRTGSWVVTVNLVN